MSISDLSDSDADMYVPSTNQARSIDNSLEDQFALLQKQQQEMAALQNGLIKCPPQQQAKQPPQKQVVKQQQNISAAKSKVQQQTYQQTAPSGDTSSLQLRQLQQRIHELEQRNQQLERAASFNEPGAVDAQTLADPTVSKKFVELNGKVRQLTAANEALKAKGAAQQRLTAQYQLEIEQLHRQLEKLTGKTIGPQSDAMKSEDELKWMQQIKKLEQDNQGLLERFGELNVKLASFQNENLKLKQFILREAGVEYDKIASDAEWRGRGERIEVLKLQVEKQQQRVKELESCLQKVQKDPDEASRAQIQQIKARCSEQLEVVEKALEEKKVTTKAQAEQILDLKEKLDRASARASALETANSRSREQLRLLAKKSKLDDQLIQDFRQQLYQGKTKTYQLQFRDELAQLRAQNAALEQKLTQALLSLQQNNTDQLQVLYAGAQLELADCRERLQILSSERIAIFQRLFELEERRLSVSETGGVGKQSKQSGNSLIEIVREMQGFQRVQAGLNAEFTKKQTALCQQFYRILLEQGVDASTLPIADVQALQERISEDPTNYVAQAQATLAKELGAALPRKRVQKGGQNVVRGPNGATGATTGVQEYLAQQPKPKPLSAARQQEDHDDLQQQMEANEQLDREFAKYVAPDDEPTDDGIGADFEKQANDLQGGNYDEE